MKASGMLCRSHAATAVCVPGDARSMVAAARRCADRAGAEDARPLADLKYARLGGDGAACARRRLAPAQPREGGRRHAAVAVTLPMVTKKSSKETAAGAAPSLPPPRPSDQVFHVVVMKVAIHCQGCAGKVRKHISKMEGVTSFNIDLENKRVTVMGHVSPVGVLESISRVKRAEFWPC